MIDLKSSTEIKTVEDCCLDFYSFIRNVLNCQYISLDKDESSKLELSLTYDIKNAKVYKRMEEIFFDIKKLDIVERVKYYLNILDLRYPWYVVMAESYDKEEPKKYVHIWTYDNDLERSYNETFYGRGTSSTREEFAAEYNKLHQGCNIEICDVSEVYEEPACELWEALGRIVTRRIEL